MHADRCESAKSTSASSVPRDNLMRELNRLFQDVLTEIYAEQFNRLFWQ